MSVILLTHEFAPFRGGAATYVEEIAAAAARLGIATEVWAPDRGTPADDSYLGFPVRRLRSSGRLSPVGISSLAWALAKHRRQLLDRPITLLSVGAQMAWAGLHAAGVLPADNVTVFFHGSELRRFELGNLWRPIVRRLYAHARGYAVASEFVAGLVKSHGLTRRETPVQLASCAVPSILQQAATASPEMRPGECRILTVARLHPRKGQVQTAQALGKLPEALRRQVVYEMVGVGAPAYRAEIESACRAAGIVAEFRGSATPGELAAAYQRCDIYMQCSRTLPRSVEGFGISYLEAGWFGRPSVAVATGGVGEAVRDGITGFLAPEGNLGQLARCVERLMTDQTLRQQMGEAGHRHAASFRWETSARRLCDFAAGLPVAPSSALYPH